MAAGTEAKIINGLLAHLRDFTTSPAIPVAWPDPQVPFEKPVDANGKPKPYLQPFEVPVPTLPLSVDEGGVNEYGGIFQISLFWPKRTGVLAAEEIRSQIIAHFAPRSKITSGGIEILFAQASRNGALSDDPYWNYPMTIRYRAFVTNPA